MSATGGDNFCAGLRKAGVTYSAARMPQRAQYRTPAGAAEAADAPNSLTGGTAAC